MDLQIANIKCDWYVKCCISSFLKPCSHSGDELHRQNSSPAINSWALAKIHRPTFIAGNDWGDEYSEAVSGGVL